MQKRMNVFACIDAKIPKKNIDSRLRLLLFSFISIIYLQSKQRETKWDGKILKTKAIKPK